jgi:hypothetical protein
MFEHLCIKCDLIFFNKYRHAKYCTLSCYLTRRIELPEKQCLYCLKNFEPKKYTHNNGYVIPKFCSAKCYFKYPRKYCRKKLNRMSICLKCDKSFNHPQKIRRFCSFKCFRSSIVAKFPQIKECLVCNVQYQAESNKRKYCGYGCSKKKAIQFKC